MMIARTIPNSSADQKLATANPETKAAISITSRALITKVKSPKERMLIGRVNMTKIGFKNALIKPKTSAAINAETNPSTTTPGKRYAVIRIAVVDISHLMRIFIKIS